MDTSFNSPSRKFKILTLAACTIALTGVSVGAEPTLAGWTQPSKSSLTAIVEELDTWLDGASDYPRRRPPPQVAFLSQQDADLMRDEATARHLDGPMRGLYNPGTATIYLVAPWSPEDPRALSTLLHELVHHRQETARHWYCDAAQEEDAYRLQERWLKTQGLESGFYWPAIILSSSCTPRDIHPQ